MFFYAIISHFEYCLTSWSLAGSTTLKKTEGLYKNKNKSLKVLDKNKASLPCLKKADVMDFLNMIYCIRCYIASHLLH